MAAVSPEVADDAARLIEVVYEEKPFTHELRAAMEKDAPLVFDEGEAPLGEGREAAGQHRGPQTRGTRQRLAPGSPGPPRVEYKPRTTCPSTPTAASRPTA